MALLHSLNERALQLKQQDEQINAELQTQRINVGLYVFDEPDDAGETCNKGSK